jgi:hypothetical protein
MQKRCGVIDCKRKYYAMGWCGFHYAQHKRGVALNVEDKPLVEAKIVDGKRRCHARMFDGSQCVRAIKAAGMCFAHHRESEDRALCELRESPIESTRRDYEGNEAALIKMQERADVR